MAISIIDNVSEIRDISSMLLMNNGKLKLLSSDEYSGFTHNEIRVFCHKNSRYGLPTTELIDCLKELIGDRTAIEIGSGYGDLGYHLGIPMTDSKVQSTPEVKAFYEAAGQPTVEYPDDVEKLEALEAVKKYKPKVVVGSWITRYVDPNKHCFGSGSMFGVKEDRLINSVETYILIGNLDIHGDKPITHRKHETIKKSWIRSRASNPENNMIFVWTNNNRC